MTIQETLKRHAGSLMAIPGVVGAAVSQCDGEPCIMVLVVKKSADLAEKIPTQLEGYPVIINETGAMHRLDQKSAGGRGQE